ncbi:MAG: tyrosine-type recombinase/integrase, partial [Nitrososphaerales archaeon]
MESFSYRYSLSKRASEIYEGYEEVRDWFNELCLTKSKRTAHDYVDMFAGFLKSAGKNPEELLRLSPKEAYNALKDWSFKELGASAHSTGRLYVTWIVVKSFLRFYGIDVKGGPPFKRTVKYLDKIPTKEELRQILNATSLSARIAIELMAYAGLRPEDICDLTYSSIKNDFERGLAPCAIYVPQRKSDNVYVTFAPECTIALLKQYFKQREAKGEKLRESSPILTNPRAPGKGVRRKTLTAKIEATMRKSGVQIETISGNKVQRMRPYSLRKYFRSNLTGHTPSEYIEAWMGHTSGLAHVYGGIRDLAPAVIERMREAYKKSEPFLLATASPLD